MILSGKRDGGGLTLPGSSGVDASGGKPLPSGRETYPVPRSCPDVRQSKARHRCGAAPGAAPPRLPIIDAEALRLHVGNGTRLHFIYGIGESPVTIHRSGHVVA